MAGTAGESGHQATHPMVAVMRSPALLRALAAYFVFNATEWATWIAILIWAYDTGGAGVAGLIAVVLMVPATIAAPFTSVLGDRFRRDRALALGYAVQALTMLVVGVALVVDAPTVVVCFVAAAATTSIVLTRPVHNALIPEIAETPAQITAGNSASSTVDGIAGFLGPLMAGVLIAFGGPGAVFLLFGSLSVLSAWVTWSLPLRRTFERDDDPEGTIRATAAGLRELRHQTGALLLTVIVGAQFVVWGLLDILTVVLGIDVLDMGQSGPGILTSALGVGALVGAGATIILIGRRRLSPAMVFGMLLTGLPLVMIVVVTLPTFAWVMLALSGAGMAFVDVAGRTLLQRAVPSNVLARVFGVQESLLTAGNAVGVAIAPLLISAFGTRGAFVATGVLLPLVGLLAWTQIRKLDESALQPGPGFALLEAIPMFTMLPQGTLEQLSRDLEATSVPAGRDVMVQGDLGDRFYVVSSGSVAVIKDGVQVATTEAGGHFGEIALLRDVQRTATVRAIDDVELYALDRDIFLEAVTGSSSAREIADDVVDRRLRDDGPA